MRNRPLDVICIGEALIDFISTKKGVKLESSPGFLKAAGGAPANVSVGLARLGKKTAFVGKVGNDSFGRFLQKTLVENKVDVSNLLFDKQHRTRLAFVSLTDEGERDFEFYGYESADTKITKEEVMKTPLGRTRILHFGSVSLVTNPSRNAVLKAAEIAKEKKIVVSFDPNLRISLWKSPTEARHMINLALDLADIVKMDIDEMEFLSGKKDPREGGRSILEYGVKLLAITLGKDGCYYLTPNTDGYEPSIDVEVKDTTGAGDGFVAGMLYMISEIQLENLTQQELYEIFRFANIIGAMTVKKNGGIPALPYKEEVELFLSSKYKESG